VESIARDHAEEERTASGKRLGEPGVVEWENWGLVDRGLRMQDDDLSLVEPLMGPRWRARRLWSSGGRLRSSYVLWRRALPRTPG
jgi:hypothetical protein